MAPNEARCTSIFDILTGVDGLLAKFDATVPGFARRHDDETTGAPPLNADGTLDRDAVSEKVGSLLRMISRPAPVPAEPLIEDEVRIIPGV